MFQQQTQACEAGCSQPSLDDVDDQQVEDDRMLRHGWLNLKEGIQSLARGHGDSTQESSRPSR